MKKILIIEDDPAITKGLTIALLEEGFEVESEADGAKGFLKANKNKYELLILDIMLPSKNGMDICRDLRSEKNWTPILMLTSKKEEIDKVLGLEVGADDYMTKPFGLRELIARVKAILRRNEMQQTKKDEYRFADVKVNFPGQEVLKGKKEIKLSVTEFKMLAFFIEHEGVVITREMLLDNVWGYDAYPTTRTVDNFILSLRKNLENDHSNPKHFLTLHKSGYKFIK